MTTAPVIRLDSLAEPMGSCLVPDRPQAPATLLHRQPLADIADLLGGARPIVLVPSQHLLLTRVSVPARTRRQSLQAIPYALEEYLADDVDQLHLSVGERDATGAFAVVALSHAAMRSLTETLEALPAPPLAAIPDVLAVPLAAGEWSMLPLADTVLIRTGRQTGFAAETDTAAAMLEIALASGHDPAPQRIGCYSGRSQALPAVIGPASSSTLQQHRHARDDPMWWFADGLDLRDGMNLLHGPYAARRAGRGLRSRFKPVAVLALIWLALEFAIDVGEFRTLNGKSAGLEAEMERIYRDSFPDAQRVVDARVQMEQRLDALRRQAGERRESFLRLLGAAAPHFSSAGGFEVLGLEFRGGRFDVEVSARNLEALDQLKLSLDADPGLDAEILSASGSGADGIRGRLRISGAER